MKKFFIPILLFSLIACNSTTPTKKKEAKIALPKNVPEKKDSTCFTGNPNIDSFWINKNYLTAKVYLFSGGRGHFSEELIVYNGNLNKTIINKKGYLLSKEEANTIADLVIKGKPCLDTLGPADCFMPNHGIVFFNKKGKPIGHITVCFLCHDMKISPYGNKFSIDTLRTIFTNKRIPIYEEDELYKYEGYKN